MSILIKGKRGEEEAFACIHCGIRWPGDDEIAVDDLLFGKPDFPVCIKSPGRDRWLMDSGINGHIFKSAKGSP